MTGCRRRGRRVNAMLVASASITSAKTAVAAKGSRWPPPPPVRGMVEAPPVPGVVAAPGCAGAPAAGCPLAGEQGAELAATRAVPGALLATFTTCATLAPTSSGEEPLLATAARLPFGFPASGALFDAVKVKLALAPPPGGTVTVWVLVPPVVLEAVTVRVPGGTLRIVYVVVLPE